MAKLEEIEAKEKRLKKEQAKLRQQKKRLLDKEHAKIGKQVMNYCAENNVEYKVATEMLLTSSSSVFSDDDQSFLKSAVEGMEQKPNGNWQMDRTKLQAFMNELHERFS